MAKKETSAAKPADNMIYKAMVDVGILLVVVFLLQFIGNNYVVVENFVRWNEGLATAALVALVAAVIGAVMLFVKVPAVKLAGKILLPTALALTAIFGSLHYSYEAMSYLYFFLVAGCSLYLVYLLYPIDFFLIAALTALSGGAFYLHGRAGRMGTADLIIYVVLALLAVATLVAANKAAAKGGMLTIGKKTLRLFSGKAGANPLYLTCAIMVACILASVLLGGTFAFYCVYAAVGGLFVAACYYTIRLN
jgi:uncharacterized integral membrane protein